MHPYFLGGSRWCPQCTAAKRKTCSIFSSIFMQLWQLEIFRQKKKAELRRDAIPLSVFIQSQSLPTLAWSKSGIRVLAVSSQLSVCFRRLPGTYVLFSLRVILYPSPRHFVKYYVAVHALSQICCYCSRLHARQIKHADILSTFHLQK